MACFEHAEPNFSQRANWKGKLVPTFSKALKTFVSVEACIFGFDNLAPPKNWNVRQECCYAFPVWLKHGTHASFPPNASGTKGKDNCKRRSRKRWQFKAHFEKARTEATISTKGCKSPTTARSRKQAVTISTTPCASRRP